MEAFAALLMAVIARLVFTALGGKPVKGTYSVPIGVIYGVIPFVASNDQLKIPVVTAAVPIIAVPFSISGNHCA